jgi:hypothetical protein
LFHIIGHKLLAYLIEFDELSWSDHRSKGDK